MNKWFRLALNSFIGIVVLNLFYGILFGGSLGVSSLFLAELLVLGTKILYISLILGIAAGTVVAVRGFILTRD